MLQICFMINIVYKNHQCPKVFYAKFFVWQFVRIPMYIKFWRFLYEFNTQEIASDVKKTPYTCMCEHYHSASTVDEIPWVHSTHTHTKVAADNWSCMRNSRNCFGRLAWIIHPLWFAFLCHRSSITINVSHILVISVNIRLQYARKSTQDLLLYCIVASVFPGFSLPIPMIRDRKTEICPAWKYSWPSMTKVAHQSQFVTHQGFRFTPRHGIIP